MIWAKQHLEANFTRQANTSQDQPGQNTSLMNSLFFLRSAHFHLYKSLHLHEHLSIQLKKFLQ